MNITTLASDWLARFHAACQSDEPLLDLEPHIWAAVGKLVREYRPPARPPEQLVARPCPFPAPEWHARQFQTWITGDHQDPWVRLRLAYHAAWLLYFLTPEDPTVLPVVSIVIPSYNAGEKLLRAVRSAVGQTYPRIEVVVVDDGSTDDSTRPLAQFGNDVRVFRQENSGPGAARNLGVRIARGEFVHFLDADDALDRDAIERQFRAFEFVGDAELCTCHYRGSGTSGVKNVVNCPSPLIGDRHCPTRDLLKSAVVRFPLHMSTTLVARWVLAETGPLDADLRQSQDRRYWFRLGLRGTKVVAINRTLATRVFHTTSLTAKAREADEYRIRCYFRDIGDLLSRPLFWPLVPHYFNRFCNHLAMYAFVPPEINILGGELAKQIGRLSEVGATQGLSALPLLWAMHRRLECELSYDQTCAAVSDVYCDIAEAIRDAVAKSAPMQTSDAEFWLSHPYRVEEMGRSTLREVIEWVERERRGGRLAFDAHVRSWLSGFAPLHAYQPRWAIVALWSIMTGSLKASIFTELFGLVCLPYEAIFRAFERAEEWRIRRWVWALERKPLVRAVTSRLRAWRTAWRERLAKRASAPAADALPALPPPAPWFAKPGMSGQKRKQSSGTP